MEFCSEIVRNQWSQGARASASARFQGGYRVTKPTKGGMGLLIPFLGVVGVFSFGSGARGRSRARSKEPARRPKNWSLWGCCVELS